jgi:hypothetical protein
MLIDDSDKSMHVEVGVEVDAVSLFMHYRNSIVANGQQ